MFVGNLSQYSVAEKVAASDSLLGDIIWGWANDILDCATRDPAITYLLKRVIGKEVVGDPAKGSLNWGSFMLLIRCS